MAPEPALLGIFPDLDDLLRQFLRCLNAIEVGLSIIRIIDKSQHPLRFLKYSILGSHSKVIMHHLEASNPISVAHHDVNLEVLRVQRGLDVGVSLSVADRQPGPIGVRGVP
jgi:hypothetical protein